MLHMAVITHGPETCAAAHPQYGELARDGLGRMEAASKSLDVVVKGYWLDAPGHAFFLLLDAPNAHAVNNLMVELKLFHWNTVNVHPVTTMDEAMPLIA